MKKNEIVVTNGHNLFIVYSISIETAKGGPLTLDWAQGLAVG